MEEQNRVFRILKIITLLEGNHRKWNAKDISGILAISERTFHRDRKIIESLNIPIYFNKELNTYDILDTFQFKPPKLSKEEAIALLLIGQVFEKINFPYFAELETAISKIMNSLPESIKNVLTEFNNTIKFESNPKVNLSKHRDTIKKISIAINECSAISIIYYSLSRDETSKREVDPYSIFYKNGAAYLVGYCHMRDDIRLFRIDRIKENEILSRKFTRPQEYTLKSYVGNIWGVERGKEINVKIKFSGFAAKYVQEYNWHDTQQIDKID